MKMEELNFPKLMFSRTMKLNVNKRKELFYKSLGSSSLLSYSMLSKIILINFS